MFTYIIHSNIISYTEAKKSMWMSGPWRSFHYITGLVCDTGDTAHTCDVLVSALWSLGRPTVRCRPIYTNANGEIRHRGERMRQDACSIALSTSLCGKHWRRDVNNKISDIVCIVACLSQSVSPVASGAESRRVRPCVTPFIAQSVVRDLLYRPVDHRRTGDTLATAGRGSDLS